MPGLPVVNDHERSRGSPTATTERSEADKLVDKMEFSELCNEFECVSSPSVEATARQLARDILEMREGNRALGTFAISVKYKDPLRSFTGRDKYKRPSWARGALDHPYVSVQEMTMLSTSVLNIKWTIQGKSKISTIFSGDVILSINSLFTLNQISGQVIEHQEDWDLSASSASGQAYFWASRWLYVAAEAGKDVLEVAKDIKSPFDKEEEDSNIFADPSGDPTKFFQVDNNPQRDVYQVGLFLAVVYLVVQFLKSTL
ncbi:hypothetical protein SUGI_0088150 [Cryptomeria japonica]|nr:hypothetical protein SUGI_0088150 [Cryptomeria japonica]